VQDKEDDLSSEQFCEGTHFILLHEVFYSIACSIVFFDLGLVFAGLNQVWTVLTARFRMTLYRVRPMRSHKGIFITLAYDSRPYS
jgi:hypothetical protein